MVRVIDLIERGFLLLLAAAFLYRFAPRLSANPHDILIVLNEIVTVLLILIRKPGKVSLAPYVVVIAFAGTAIPLLVSPQGRELAPDFITAPLMMLGLIIAISAKAFLNRGFGIVAANRGVKRRGPYRLVRHPMYAGYMLVQMGFLLSHFSVWNLAVYLIAWPVQILRLREEEAFLLTDHEYVSYAQSVRSRLLPGVF